MSETKCCICGRHLGRGYEFETVCDKCISKYDISDYDCIPLKEHIRKRQKFDDE